MDNATFTKEDALQLLGSLRQAHALITRFAAADTSNSPLHDALRERSTHASADLASLQVELVQILSQTADPATPHVIAQLAADQKSTDLAIGPTVFPNRAAAEETLEAFASARRHPMTLAFPMPEAFVASLTSSLSP